MLPLLLQGLRFLMLKMNFLKEKGSKSGRIGLSKHKIHGNYGTPLSC